MDWPKHGQDSLAAERDPGNKRRSPFGAMTRKSTGFGLRKSRPGQKRLKPALFLALKFEKGIGPKS